MSARRTRGVMAVSVLVLATVLSTPQASAAPTTPPPAGAVVISPGQVPGICTQESDNAYRTNYGYYWSDISNRWVSAPRCYPRWGFLEASPSQVAVAGATITVTARHDDGRIPGWIAKKGGMAWQYPGTLVAGCTTTDITCTVRIGKPFEPPSEWQWHEFHVSGPGRLDILPPSYAPRCQADDPCLVLGTQAWSWVGIRPANGPQVPDFTHRTDAGRVDFLATSTDPAGQPLQHEWAFGDGAVARGDNPAHTYTRPGDYTVTLTATATGGRSATTSRRITIAPASLGVSVELADGAAPPLSVDKPVGVRVTLSASDRGVGDLTGVRLSDGVLSALPPELFQLVSGPTPAPATLTLSPGQRQVYDLTVKPTAKGRYTLSSKVTATDGLGKSVTAEATSPGEVGQSLDVSISLDPPFADQPEGPKGPEPVKVTAKVTLTNTTTTPMTGIILRSLDVTRTKAGQGLYVTQTGGVTPGADGYQVGDLAPGKSKDLLANFVATDDSEVEFRALATGTTTQGEQIGSARQRWSVKPKYLLDLTTEVVRPTSGALLPAGETIRLKGTVKNLSTTATIELGPLFPTLRGNAGVMSLTYDGAGRDPKDLAVPEQITLGPNESRDFSVRVLTSGSDPRQLGGAKPHGGTFAQLTFTPWGRATLEDGTVTVVKPELVRATEAALTQRVGIDDSIAIPQFNYLAFGGAVMVGAAEGVYNGTVATVMSVADIVQLVKLPYTVIRATAEFQTLVWTSFTEEERRAFATDAALMSAAVLARNVELGLKGAGELFDRAMAAIPAAMNEMAKAWEVGDITTLVHLYVKYAADAITEVALPIAYAKLAKSPKAAAALVRAQEALNAKMATVIGRGMSAERLAELGPVLTAIKSGTELNPTEIERLYGISVAELGELKAIAQKHRYLVTVRARHFSSLRWIEEYNAALKPEVLKLKSVSELDTRLGYNVNDIGRLVFKKPQPLIDFEAGKGNIDELFEAFLRQNGFVEGTVDYQNASKRLFDRMEEWQELELKYKDWDKRGWIETSLNYKAQGIDASVAKGTGQFKGFQMERVGPKGSEEYVIKMLDGKTGRFVPVTGDIDSLAYTHLDGSPLTPAEHAGLLLELRNNPLLRMPHGESATFANGGVKFVSKQLKPGEPALQLAPGGLAPRVVRLSEEKSRWVSPEDYNLHWEGGFVYSGDEFQQLSNPFRRPSVKTGPPIPAPRLLPRALPNMPPGSTEPNVGRCAVTYTNDPNARSLLLDAEGALAELVKGQLKKLVEDAAAQRGCFTEGPPLQLRVKPATQVAVDAAAGATRVAIDSGPEMAAVGPDGLTVGQEVTIGAGTDHPETGTIAGFGSIVLREPLRQPHAAGEVVVVTGGAPAVAGPAPTGSVTRVAGVDRVDTAIRASQSRYADRTAGAVVLARSDDFPDALTGTPLAVAKGGPLLLTGSASLDPAVRAEVARVLPAGGTVYVLGGIQALSASVADELTATGFRVVRYAGVDRFSTATAVASDGLGSPSTVLEATGLDFADALAAGAAAAGQRAAVLLTRGAEQSTATAAYLRAHPGVRYAVGGPAAAADPGATPLVGSDRFETAVVLARRFFGAATSLGVASGETFPDALTGGAVSAVGGGPLLLVPRTGPLPTSVLGWLQGRQARAVVYGGTAAVGEDVVAGLRGAVAG